MTMRYCGQLTYLLFVEKEGSEAALRTVAPSSASPRSPMVGLLASRPRVERTFTSRRGFVTCSERLRSAFVTCSDNQLAIRSLPRLIAAYRVRMGDLRPQNRAGSLHCSNPE